MDSMDAKAKLGFNLQHKDAEAFNVTLTFIVYKTIERNYNITLNQLKGLFNSHYMMVTSDELIESTVGSLLAKSLFDCVTRWQRPNSTHAIHLRVKENPSFESWMQKMMNDYPELKSFEAPVRSEPSKQTAKQ
jgi:hypothetical protein